MSIRFDMWQEERENATVQPNGLRVLAGVDRLGRPRLLVWTAKAIKPAVDYWFGSVEKRDAYLERFVKAFDEREERKRRDRATRTGTPEMLGKVTVGMVFEYSWGYDQTNVDYFQVVARTGCSVKVRPIAAERVPGTEGFMCDRVRPAVGAFIDKCRHCRLYQSAAQHNKDLGCFDHDYEPAEPILKRINFWNGEPQLRFDHGIGSPVKVLTFANAEPLVVASHYRSSYA